MPRNDGESAMDDQSVKGISEEALPSKDDRNRGFFVFFFVLFGFIGISIFVLKLTELLNFRRFSEQLDLLVVLGATLLCGICFAGLLWTYLEGGLKKDASAEPYINKELETFIGPLIKKMNEEYNTELIKIKNN